MTGGWRLLPAPPLAARLLVVTLVAGTLLGVPAARANGNHTHIGITLLAISHLPDGPLKSLVGDPALRKMLLNGTIFPDGGYAIKHNYGETAHWEPLHRALGERIAAQCGSPSDLH